MKYQLGMNSDLIQTITGIATLLTAVAALFTILEMRRQRVEGYRPVIAIDDEAVNLYSSAQERRTIAFQPAGKVPASSSSTSGISFRLRNVGAGAALAVEARWAFDAIDFAAVVAKCDPEVGRNISVEDDLVRFDVQGNGLSWMAREAQEHHLGALSASPEKAVDVPLPFAYTFLASAYFNGLLSQGLQAALQSALPPLTLAVSFRDRAGSEHQSTYRVELNLFYLSTGGIPVGDGRGWTHVGSGMFTVRAA